MPGTIDETTRGAMDVRNLLTLGVAGTALSAVCCFTPLLVITLGVLGLGAWVAWLDFVLLPALLLSSAVVLASMVILIRRRGAKRTGPA